MSLRPTILDVLDNAMVGGEPALDALTAGRLNAFELLERAREFYESWDPSPAGPEELRIHPMTRETRGYSLVPAVAAMMTNEQIEQSDLEYEGDYFTLDRLQRVYATALLCADTVIELDPVSFLVRQYSSRSGNETDLRIGLIAAIWQVEQLRPLIEQGIMLLQPVPAGEDWNEDYSRARELLRETEHPRIESYVAKIISALRVAGVTESTVLPMWQGTWGMLELLVGGDLQDDNGQDVKVAAALGEVELPWLTGLEPKTLVRIHQEEEAFVEWRAALRVASRMICAEPGSVNFSKEARAVIEDALLPQLDAAKRSLSRSHALRAAVREQPLRVGLGSAAAAGTALAAGLSLSTAIASSAASALGASVAPVLVRKRPDGSARVIFELLN